ncbi:MAG: methyltransferase family protein [Bryobacteraceae bacterium]
MRTMVLWLRGAVFTILVPGVLAGYIPYRLRNAGQGGSWIGLAGWAPVAAGAGLYLWCLSRFLLVGGTPAIHLTRPVRFLIGTPPPGLVRRGPYRFTRNPMYVAVVLMVLGQAALYGSWRVAVYGAGCWLAFYLIVVLVEEPHLRAVHGAAYDEYCQRTPRWIGLRRGR